MSRAWREEIAVVVHAKGWPVPVILPLRPETCDTCEESLRIADAVLAKVAELLDSEEAREAVLKVLLADAWPIEDAVDATDAALGVLRERCGGGA